MSDPTFKVALTIDTEHPDRPRRQALESHLLETLRRERVRATFFVQGRWASAYPRTLAQIADDGHLIGNHSHYHARMSGLTDRGIAADLAEAEAAIAEVTGRSPKPWFRCPFGDGHDDPRVLRVLDECGYRDQYWDVDPYDWEPGRTVRQLVRRVVTEACEHGDGAVVVLHSWPPVTARALPAVIAGLRERGAEPVGLDEVVGS